MLIISIFPCIIFGIKKFFHRSLSFFFFLERYYTIYIPIIFLANSLQFMMKWKLSWYLLEALAWAKKDYAKSDPEA